jgi:micrococcal nuclease
VLAAWAGLVIAGCVEALPRETVVRRVIDGDTIEASDGRLIRYLGIDAPEVRRRAGGHWVVDPELFAEEATTLNRTLVEGRRVRLEYDVETHDRFGRLLAYVYIGDTMANGELIKSGLAKPLVFSPNVKHAQHLRAWAAEARQARRGLWSVTE